MASRQTGDVVSKKRLVKLSGSTVVHNTATATDDPIGISQYDGALGDTIEVSPIVDDDEVPFPEVTLSGSCAAGVDLYAAANGMVQALPIGAGTYRRVGKSIIAGVDGDIMAFIPLNDGTTKTQ